MQSQIPRGFSHLKCPFHKKAMSEVCDSCPRWTQVRGKNPNTGEDTDQWNCSLAWLPMLLLETAQQSRQGAAATESFRNEMVSANQEFARLQRLQLAPPK